MGSRRLLVDFLARKDDGSVCTDATVTAYLAGSTTPTSLYGDRDLTVDLGSSELFSSIGVPPDLWGSDQISYKLVIAGTGMTTLTRDYYSVASGSSSSTTPTSTELVNQLRNGGFSTWSGATSFSNISGAGTGVEVADGWFFVQSTAASNSITRQPGVGTGVRYALRMQRPAGSTSTNKLRLWQTPSIDDAWRLAGQTVTLSFTATAGANYSPTSGQLNVRLHTGTTEGESGDLIESSGFGGNVVAINQTPTITTTRTRYQYTATLATSIKEVGIQLSMQGVGTAGANDWVQIEDVQLEIASSASAFAAAPEPVGYLRNKLTSTGRQFIACSAMPSAGLAFAGSALALANDLASLESFSGTGSGGLAYRSGTDTWAAVTIGSNLGFSGGTLGSSLGTMATQAASAVAITGGTVSSLTSLGVSGDSYPVVFNSTNNNYVVGISKASTFGGFLGTDGSSGLVITNAGVNTTLTITNGAVTVAGGGLTSRVSISSETSGTLTSASSNKIVITTAGVTINDGVHAANDQMLIYNNSGSSVTITQDTGMTLRLDGTATTGNRTLGPRGKMHVFFNTNAEAICSGSGVS